MTGVTSIEDLMLIGWNDVVDERLLPARVAPVFSFRDDPGTVLLPPFRVVEGVVVGGVRAKRGSWDEQLARRQSSALDEALAARPGHILWLDLEGNPHYEPSAKANRNLDQMAEKLMDGAQRALENGDLEKAMTLAQGAFNAKDRWVDPLALKAAVSRHRGRPHEVELFAGLASVSCSRESFGSLVHAFSHKFAATTADESVAAPVTNRPGPRDPGVDHAVGTSPMCGVAAECPDDASRRLFPVPAKAAAAA